MRGAVGGHEFDSQLPGAWEAMTVPLVRVQNIPVMA